MSYPKSAIPQDNPRPSRSRPEGDTPSRNRRGEDGGRASARGRDSGATFSRPEEGRRERPVRPERGEARSSNTRSGEVRSDRATRSEAQSPSRGAFPRFKRDDDRRGDRPFRSELREETPSRSPRDPSRFNRQAPFSSRPGRDTTDEPAFTRRENRPENRAVRGGQDETRNPRTPRTTSHSDWNGERAPRPQRSRPININANADDRYNDSRRERPARAENVSATPFRRGIAEASESNASPDIAERLQKVLAQTGLGARREIEAWIVAGRIEVNGRVAELGQKVVPSDRIKVNGKLVHTRFAAEVPRVLLYHKPEGEIVSRSDPEGRPTVFEHLPIVRKGRWIAIGRLDYNTSGLLMFTNDGTLANQLMHPRFEIEREYAVRILGELTPEQIETLKTGVQLEDGLAQFNTLFEAGGEGVNRWYHVTLNEGRNREVRRMFEALELTVSRLMRVRYGTVALPTRLKRGMWMELPAEEVCKLMGIPVPQSVRQKAIREKETRRGPAVHRTRPIDRGVS